MKQSKKGILPTPLNQNKNEHTQKIYEFHFNQLNAVEIYFFRSFF